MNMIFLAVGVVVVILGVGCLGGWIVDNLWFSRNWRRK